MTRLTVLGAVAAIAALSITLAAAASDREAALDGVEFIQQTQEDDGGFGGFGPGQTFDAVLAIRSAGVDPNTVTTADNSPADFLRANVDEVTGDPGSAAKAALAADALDLDPADVDGTDFVDTIESFHDAGSGAFAEDAFSQSLAVLGLVCTGNEVDDSALGYLAERQLEDGGWGFEDAGDPDTTALAVQALVEGGMDAGDDAVQSALGFFHEAQHADGGWGAEGDESNANSTALVIQALLTLGEDPDGDDWAIDGATPWAYITGAQQDDGSFPGFDPAFATNQAVPALAGRTFCEAPVTEIETEVEPAPADDAAAVDDARPEAPAAGTGQATTGGNGSPLFILAAALMVSGAGMYVATRVRQDG